MTVKMLRIRQSYKQEPREAIRLKGRLKLAKIMSLSEDEFLGITQEIRDDPLFEELKILTVIRYKRFPGISIFTSRAIPLNPEISPGSPSFYGNLSGQEEIMQIIEKLGKENFKRYFLNNNEIVTIEEIVERCNITIEQAEKIDGFVDKFYLENEFTSASYNYRSKDISYTTVAGIEETDNGFIITSFSPDVGRVKWTIHEEVLKKLGNRFSPQKKKKIKGLLNKIILVNRRKSVIYRILENIVEIQRDYLDSGDVRDLKLFTQRSLSKKISIEPSLISRAIAGRAIETPKSGVIPLKKFFPGKREIRKKLIRKIFEREKDSISLSDEKLRRILNGKYYLSSSRRVVCDCRRELNIPSSYQREKSYE